MSPPTSRPSDCLTIELGAPVHAPTEEPRHNVSKRYDDDVNLCWLISDVLILLASSSEISSTAKASKRSAYCCTVPIRDCGPTRCCGTTRCAQGICKFLRNVAEVVACVFWWMLDAAMVNAYCVYSFAEKKACHEPARRDVLVEDVILELTRLSERVKPETPLATPKRRRQTDAR